MQPAKRVLFYADTNVFSGHDVMSLAASDAIREYFPAVEIIWLISADNERMLQQLRQKRYIFSFLKSTPRERLLKHPFAVLYSVLANSSKVRRIAPDVVVVAQGVVTLSFLGSIAMRLAGVAHCCYLPMGALASECDSRGDSRLLDSLWRFSYRHTPNFIAIDAEQKRLIAVSNPRADIKIVENYVPRTSISSCARHEARREWQILDSRLVIGVVGRVRFDQKNQDWLVRQLSADAFWKRFLVLFVGDGPDLPQLRQMVRALNLEGQVRMIGWTDRVHALYPALDLLLIPSRAEGVPLVMLEALANRVPVAGSNRDGMKEWLPPEWRFEVGDGEGMKRAVLAATQQDHEEFWRTTAAHLDLIHDRKRFATGFLEAILSFI
jgi:glycosyltransferase involved in cell wall biosynthesis